MDLGVGRVERVDVVVDYGRHVADAGQMRAGEEEVWDPRIPPP